MRRTLNPDFLTDPFELNFTVIVVDLDLREEKSLGTDEPQSQTFKFDCEFSTSFLFYLPWCTSGLSPQRGSPWSCKWSSIQH